MTAPTAYGYSRVQAISQTGLPVSRACFPQGSACMVQASFFTASGQPYAPAEIRYSVYDLVSGLNVVPWTEVPQGASADSDDTVDGSGTVDEDAQTSVSVLITSAQNAMVSLTRENEAHEVLFEITDADGNQFFESCSFDLIRVIPIYPTADSDDPVDSTTSI